MHHCELDWMETFIESGWHIGWVSDLYMHIHICMHVSDTWRKIDLNKNCFSGTFWSTGAQLHDRQVEILESSLRGRCINCLPQCYINSAGPSRVGLSRHLQSLLCALQVDVGSENHDGFWKYTTPLMPTLGDCCTFFPSCLMNRGLKAISTS